MNRISLMREKRFKKLKLWNYRTLLMFLAISITIFLLLLLVSGCKIDDAEHICGKPFTTPLTLKITGYAQVQTAGLIRISINNRESLADEECIKIVYYNNSNSKLINSISASIDFKSIVVIESAVVSNQA